MRCQNEVIYSQGKHHLKAESVVCTSDKNLLTDSSLEVVFLIRKECCIKSSYFETVSGSICVADFLLIWKAESLYELEGTQTTSGNT